MAINWQQLALDLQLRGYENAFNDNQMDWLSDKGLVRQQINMMWWHYLDALGYSGGLAMKMALASYEDVLDNLWTYRANEVEPSIVLDPVLDSYIVNGELGDQGFSSVVNFTGPEGRTYTNSEGLLVTVGLNEPRINNHIDTGSGLFNAGQLFESVSRTNLVTLSTRFDTGWSGTDVTVTPNTHISPDGTMNADTLTRSGEQGYLIKSSAGVTGQTKSIYARTVSGTGTVGLLSHNSVPASEVALTEEWQRFDLPVDTAETGGSNFYAVDFRVGDLTEVVVWGAQLEAGPYPTSFIETDTTTVTLAGETMQIDPAVLQAALGATMPAAVSIAMQGHMTYKDENAFSTVRYFNWEADSSNRISYELSTSGVDTGQMFFVAREVGVNKVSSTSDTDKSPGVNVPFNYACRHLDNFIRGASDGVLATSSVPPSLLNLIDQPVQLLGTFTGNLSRFVMYADDIGNDGIVEVTQSM